MLKTNDGFFHTETRYPSWDKPEMSRFIEHHPEFQSRTPVDWNN
ncbi:MAG: hypothetical protein OQK69_09535 [Gammaproteobacteria bacterium]|nr:hypothetical protein [Gammaproteobacteria bacterium]